MEDCMSIAQAVPVNLRMMAHRVIDATRQKRRRHVPLPLRWNRLRHYVDLQSTIRKVWPYTMVPAKRLSNLYYECLLLGRQIPGDIVECGVCNGGTAALLGHACQRAGIQRKLRLFDSFQGLPAPSREDGQRAQGYEGKCLGQIGHVREVLGRMKIPDQQVDIIPGWFNETFPKTRIDPIAFLHIDADFYEPVKLCLQTFWDSIAPGGCVVFDDYHLWEGCDRAAHEFLEQRGLCRELAELRRTRHFLHKSA
jgi:O-methyltransferase